MLISGGVSVDLIGILIFAWLQWKQIGVLLLTSAGSEWSITNLFLSLVMYLRGIHVRTGFWSMLPSFLQSALTYNVILYSNDCSFAISPNQPIKYCSKRKLSKTALIDACDIRVALFEKQGNQREKQTYIKSKRLILLHNWCHTFLSEQLLLSVQHASGKWKYMYIFSNTSKSGNYSVCQFFSSFKFTCNQLQVLLVLAQDVKETLYKCVYWVKCSSCFWT